MAKEALPSINYVYADERGNIGYLSNGIYPLRKDGFGLERGVMPGDRSDLIWTQAAAVRGLAAAVGSQVRLGVQLQQHAVPRHRPRRAT